MNRLKRAALGMWLLAFLIGTPLSAYFDAHFHSDSQHRRPADVALDLLGDGRTLLARYLWFKMDLIHEILDSEHVPNYQQKDVIPLLRMITYLEPTFADAYDTLAFDVWKGYNHGPQAMKLIQEGLEYSPNSYLLLFRAEFFAYEMKQWPLVADYARRAFAAADNNLDRLNADRLLYHMAVKTNNWQEGIPAAQIYVQLHPEFTEATVQLKKWQAMQHQAGKK
jgi:hypothetical protein